MTVLMQEMTSPEVAEAVAAGKATALLACGAIEQHGPHLPLGTDTFLGTAIAERAARLAGNALVAPTLALGLSDHHARFAGTLSLRPQTFVDLVADVCTGLARHGFRRVVLFPSHGGNADMLRAQLPWLARAHTESCEVVLTLDPAELIPRWAEALAQRGVTVGRMGTHAGYAETSMMLAQLPHLVRIDRAEPGLRDDNAYGPDAIRRTRTQTVVGGVHSQSANGVLGDPTGSDAEAGEELISIAAEIVARDAAAPYVLGLGTGQPG
jgi:creatinine amidohydrolase